MGHSCWTCGLVSLGGDAFPGRCKWFLKNPVNKKNITTIVDIPPKKMDRGCKFWQAEKWDEKFNKRNEEIKDGGKVISGQTA